MTITGNKSCAWCGSFIGFLFGEWPTPPVFCASHGMCTSCGEKILKDFPGADAELMTNADDAHASIAGRTVGLIPATGATFNSGGVDGNAECATPCLSVNTLSKRVMSAELKSKHGDGNAETRATTKSVWAWSRYQARPAVDTLGEESGCSTTLRIFRTGQPEGPVGSNPTSPDNLGECVNATPIIGRGLWLALAGDDGHHKTTHSPFNLSAWANWWATGRVVDGNDVARLLTRNASSSLAALITSPACIERRFHNVSPQGGRCSAGEINLPVPVLVEPFPTRWPLPPKAHGEARESTETEGKTLLLRRAKL